MAGICRSMTAFAAIYERLLDFATSPRELSRGWLVQMSKGSNLPVPRRARERAASMLIEGSLLMNRLSVWIAAASFAAVAAPAFADEVRFVNNEIGYEVVVSPSTATRARVVADLQQAQRDGDLASSYEFEMPLETAPSAKSREQVQREATAVSDRERTAQNALYGPNA